jgi:hypothetical protein
MVIDGDHRPFFLSCFAGGGIPVYPGITLSLRQVDFPDITDIEDWIAITFRWSWGSLRVVMLAISRGVAGYGLRGQ